MPEVKSPQEEWELERCRLILNDGMESANKTSFSLRKIAQVQFRALVKTKSSGQKQHQRQQVPRRMVGRMTGVVCADGTATHQPAMVGPTLYLQLSPSTLSKGAEP